MANEHLFPIRNNGMRNTMKLNDIVDEGLSHLIATGISLQGNEDHDNSV